MHRSLNLLTIASCIGLFDSTLLNSDLYNRGITSTTIAPSSQQSTAPLESKHLASSLKYIGPHNIVEHFSQLENQKSSIHGSFLENLKSSYKIIPIMRDLHTADLSDQELFEILIKREIAWNYGDLNEFGLMNCGDDLKFNAGVVQGYIELIPDGRRISVQKFKNIKEYNAAAQEAKDLQTKCLIKGLEKTSGSVTENNCKSKIPFCFSDSWGQIWWKVQEN